MPSVLIQDQTPRNQYTATNGQTVFAYDFTLFAETDIEVYSRADDDVEPDDFEQELRLNIDYTVDLNASTVTLLVAAGVGQIITLVRNMPEERLNLYTNGTPITADALNTDQESAVLMAQQNTMYSRVLGLQYNKSAIIDYTNPQGGDTILPVLLPGQTWVKDPTNNFIEAVTIGGGGSGDVSMLTPTTGSNPGSVAVWNNIGILTDTGVTIDTNDNITGAASGTFGNIRIGVTTPNTIDTAATQLDIAAAAGQATNIGKIGDTLTLGGLIWPAADGTAGYFIKTDGAGNLSFASGGGGAPIASTKYNLVQFADATGGLQDSGIDYQAGVLSGMTEVDVGNLEISGNTIAAGNANGNIVLAPNGTGVTQSNAELEVRSGNDLRLFRTNNANYVGFKAGSPAGNQVWTLPDADGANGEVLTTNGAGVLNWTTGGGAGGGGNWVQVGTVTAANSATVDLVSVFSSTYTQYMIVARNVTFQTSGQSLLMRVGTGATPTWKSGGSDYAYSSFSQASNGSTPASNYSGADSAIVLASTATNSSTLPTSLCIKAFDPFNAAYQSPFIAEVQTSSGVSTMSYQSMGAVYVTAEAVSSLRFLMSSGNIVSGTFEVYGFNPSGGGSGGSIAGNVVQTIHTAAIGNTGPSAVLPFNLSITPSSATSRIRVTLNISQSASQAAPLCLRRNGVNLTTAGSIIGLYMASGQSTYNFSYIDSPATTLAITYDVAIVSGNYRYDGGSAQLPAITMTAEEIGA